MNISLLSTWVFFAGDEMEAMSVSMVKSTCSDTVVYKFFKV